MKYCTRKLYEGINSFDAEERAQAEVAWRKASEDYSEYFNSIKHFIPNQFLELYSRMGQFHDFDIQQLSYTFEGDVAGQQQYSVKARLNNASSDVCLDFLDVNRFSSDFDVPFDNCCPVWLYSEIEYSQQYHFTFRVMCTNGEFSINCKQISASLVEC